MPDRLPVGDRRLHPGQRLLLLSDGILGRPLIDGTTLGIDGVHAAALKAHTASAAGTLRAIEDAVREAVVDPLDDDATLVILAPADAAAAAAGNAPPVDVNRAGSPARPDGGPRR
jgi:hypothetical protein